MGLSYATFSDPDGNSWPFQEMTTSPGRPMPERRPANQLKIWSARCAVQRPHKVKMKRRSGKPIRTGQNWYD
ncbi:MAG: hypothetical protein JWO91_997 [Acidobacteriaceae bacterium]|nr:hypothetical protein [Acidobacteriaceae bacterium]